MDSIDTVVIGAGVVGLAAARALARAGREVVILEAESIIGSGVSSRNSEVIHAGIYYPKGSVKAAMCVAGRDALYAYCASRNVPHMRLGKLIVATNEAEVGQLERIAAAGAGNGVDDLKWLSGEEARTLEPALNAEVAILSPSTGIVDSHALMLSYLGEAEDAGAVIAFETKVTQAAIETDGVALWVNGDSAPALKAQLVINAAGLSALDLARAFEGYAADVPAPKQFAKGNYFTLAGRAPFSHLIYPAPEPGGLGVHLTLDLGGQGKFGPDVEWIESIDYDVDPTRCEKFYAAVRKYWPSLKDDALTPAYAGVRPKIVGQGEAAGDFVIAGPETHGAPGLINLFGIESPGLTSSLAIADEVARIAAETR